MNQQPYSIKVNGKPAYETKDFDGMQLPGVLEFLVNRIRFAYTFPRVLDLEILELTPKGNYISVTTIHINEIRLT